MKELPLKHFESKIHQSVKGDDNYHSFIQNVFFRWRVSYLTIKEIVHIGTRFRALNKSKLRLNPSKPGLGAEQVLLTYAAILI